MQRRISIGDASYLACFALAVVLFGGCSDANLTVADTEIDGDWSGSVSGSRIAFRIGEISSVLSGVGFVDDGPNRIAFLIVGTLDGASVSLSLVSTLQPEVTLIGSISGNALSATLNGATFVNKTVMLEKGPFVEPLPEVRSVVVSPQTTTIGRGQTVQFSATVDVSPGLSPGVTWFVTGGTGMTVSETGLVAATITAEGDATVCAVANADSNKKGCAVVSILP